MRWLSHLWISDVSLIWIDLFHIQGAVTFKDLFIAPTFDELDEVAIGADGQPKKLTTKQLEEVREMG